MDVNQTDTGETEYSAPTPASGGECSRIEIEPSANGGFIAKCFYKQQDDGKGRSRPYVEPDSFAFSSFDDLVAWERETLGAPAQAPAAPEAPATPAPAA